MVGIESSVSLANGSPWLRTRQTSALAILWAQYSFARTVTVVEALHRIRIYTGVPRSHVHSHLRIWQKHACIRTQAHLCTPISGDITKSDTICRAPNILAIMISEGFCDISKRHSFREHQTNCIKVRVSAEQQQTQSTCRFGRVIVIVIVLPLSLLLPILSSRPLRVSGSI